MLLLGEDLGVEGFLQDGRDVGGEGQHDQLLALVEGLMAHGLEGVGGDHLADGSTREGHVGDTDGTVGHGDRGGVARVGDELQTGGHHTVEVAVDDTDGIADGIGLGLGAVLISVEGLGLGGLEGLQTAVREGIVTQIGEGGAQLHGEVGHGLLQEGLRTQIGSRGEVSLHHGGVGEGVVAHVGGLVQMDGDSQRGAVGESTLLQLDAVGIQGDLGHLLVVDEGILAHGLQTGEIGILQSGVIEGVGAHRHHVGKVEVLQHLAVEEGLVGNMGQTLAQLHALELTALGKGVGTEGGGRGQIHRLQISGVEAVDVVPLLVVELGRHGAVHEDAQHIAAEGRLTDGGDAREIHGLQGVVVVEGAVTDDGPLAQGHALQLGRAEEGGVTDDGVLTDGQLGHGGGEDVVVQSLVLHLVGGGGEVGVDIQTEGGITDGDVVADGDRLQGLALAEGGLAQGHAVGDHQTLQSRVSEGVVTDDRHAREIGGGLDGGVVEGVAADGGQLAQGQGLQIAEIGEGVVADHGDLRHPDGGDLAVAREGTRTDGGDLGIGQLKAALDTGSHQGEGVSFLI